MAEKTDLNVSPYYDDYNENNNFHKVLFRAGRALQSRELIQSQSILQNQIERFGGHMFKEGSFWVYYIYDRYLRCLCLKSSMFLS